MQPRHAAAADVHLAEKQIGEHAHQRQHANDHHPRDPGRRIAMRPQQDSRDHRQLEDGDEGDSDQRVVKRGEHQRIWTAIWRTILIIAEMGVRAGSSA